MATTLTQLHRHYSELFLLVVVLLAVAVGTTILLVMNEGNHLMAVFLAILSLLFVGYVVQREITIRRLSHQALEDRLKEITALHNAMETMTAEQRPEKALDAILSAAVSLCGATRGSIMLVDHDSHRFVVAASRGLKAEHQSNMPRLDQGMAGKVVATGRPILIKDPSVTDIDGYSAASDSSLRGSLCVPLRLEQKIIGVLNCSVVGAGSRQLTEFDLELMNLFANYAVLVLERARSGQHQRQAV